VIGVGIVVVVICCCCGLFVAVVVGIYGVGVDKVESNDVVVCYWCWVLLFLVVVHDIVVV